MLKLTTHYGFHEVFFKLDCIILTLEQWMVHSSRGRIDKLFRCL